LAAAPARPGTVCRVAGILVPDRHAAARGAAARFSAGLLTKRVRPESERAAWHTRCGVQAYTTIDYAKRVISQRTIDSSGQTARVLRNKFIGRSLVTSSTSSEYSRNRNERRTCMSPRSVPSFLAVVWLSISIGWVAEAQYVGCQVIRCALSSPVHVTYGGGIYLSYPRYDIYVSRAPRNVHDVITGQGTGSALIVKGDSGVTWDGRNYFSHPAYHTGIVTQHYYWNRDLGSWPMPAPQPIRVYRQVPREVTSLPRLVGPSVPSPWPAPINLPPARRVTETVPATPAPSYSTSCPSVRCR
jgi:hypothetical protein